MIVTRPLRHPVRRRPAPLAPSRCALTRRGLMGGLGAIAAGAGLAGCNSAGPVSSPSETRTVDTANGPIDIPVAPTRVVCTDFYTTYALLDVGFTPAGTAEASASGVLPAQQAAYDALPKVGTTTALDYEAIAALGPDLILGTQVPGVAEDLYAKLSGIAPTVLFAASSPGDWKARAVRAAETVDRGAAGQELADRYTARVAELREAHTGRLASTTWALLRATTTGVIFTDGPTSWSGVVLADLGARFTAAAPTDTVGTEISLERLDLLADADVVLYLANATGAVDPSTDAVVSNPAFAKLVGEGVETVPLSGYYAAHYLDGLAVLDQIEAVLTAG